MYYNNFMICSLLILMFILYYNNKNKIKYDDSLAKVQNVNDIRNKQKLYRDFSVDTKQTISLNGNKVEKYYHKNTLDENMKLLIIEMINIILKKTNKMNNLEHYVIKEIHDIHQQIDMNRNQRYLVHFFIYGVKTYTTKKLLVDFLIINSELYINYIGEDIASIYAMINKYDVKMSEELQSMKKPYSYGIFGININDGLEKNTAKILDDFYRIQKLKVIEYDKSINEYPDYVSKLNGVYKTNITDLMHKFLPKNIPSITSPLFCDKFDSSSWDARGINFEKKDCIANNNTYNYKPNIPIDAPGMDIHPRSYSGEFSDQLQNIGYNTNGYNIPTRAY